MGYTVEQKIFEQNNLTQEPTGFLFPKDVVVTYNSTNRTITLTNVGNVLFKGIPIKTITEGWISAPHGTTLDTSYFLYYDGTNFIWSNSPWEFYYLQIAYVWYGTTNKFAIREPHGITQWQVHKGQHETTGTYRESGGTLADYTLLSTTAANRRPSISTALINDEDVPTVLSTLPQGGLYTRASLSGAGTNVFTVDSAEIINLSTNQPYYNRYNGSTYVQTLLGNNNYMCIWQLAAPMTADAESQKYRYIFMQGQKEHTTLLAAQAETLADMNLGNLAWVFTEFVFINKIIIRYTAANWSIQEVYALTGTRQDLIGNVATGIYLSAVTTDSTLTGNGTTGSPLGVALNNANTWTAKQTFNVLPESSVAPTTDNQLVNKAYVDANSGGSTTPPPEHSYKGTITVNTDFPLIANVQAGWWYTVEASVTDNAGVLYTDTQLSFIAGQTIYWTGSTWKDFSTVASTNGWNNYSGTWTRNGNQSLIINNANVLGWKGWGIKINGIYKYYVQNATFATNTTLTLLGVNLPAVITKIEYDLGSKVIILDRGLRPGSLFTATDGSTTYQQLIALNRNPYIYLFGQGTIAGFAITTYDGLGTNPSGTALNIYNTTPTAGTVKTTNLTVPTSGTSYASADKLTQSIIKPGYELRIMNTSTGAEYGGYHKVYAIVIQD